VREPEKELKFRLSFANVGSMVAKLRLPMYDDSDHPAGRVDEKFNP
jgi:hypothetical protein